MKTLMPALAAWLLLASYPGHAAPTPAIDEYLAELARVEAASQPVSLETLFVKADALQGELMQLDKGGMAAKALIETFSDEEYALLQARLRGVHLQRGMEIFVQPLPDFFSRLAKAHGRAADIEFFRLYANLWDDKLFPSYMQPRARVLGCVRYGEGLLLEIHDDWLRYARRYPGEYATTTAQNIADFEEMFSLGTCACGGRDSVIRELKGYIKRYPKGSAAPAARKRWKELYKHEEDLPPGCG